jgi:preprotein translocase subunit YajC
MNVLDFLVTPAFAETAAQPQAAGGGFSLIIMFAVFFLFMYLAIWRPQNKRAKEHRQLLNSVAKWDEVVTSGGLLGKVAKVSDQYITLLLSDNLEVIVQKASIVNTLPKGTMKAI